MPAVTPSRRVARTRIRSNTTGSEYAVHVFQGNIYAGTTALGRTGDVVGSRLTYGPTDPDGLGKNKFYTAYNTSGVALPTHEYISEGIRRKTMEEFAGYGVDMASSSGFIGIRLSFATVPGAGVAAYAFRCAAPGSAASNSRYDVTGVFMTNGWCIKAYVDAGLTQLALLKNGVQVATSSLALPATGDIMQVEGVLSGAGTVGSPSRYEIWIDGTRVINHTDTSDPYAAQTWHYICEQEVAGTPSTTRYHCIFNCDTPFQPGAIDSNSVDDYCNTLALGHKGAGEQLPVYVTWDAIKQTVPQVPTSVGFSLQSGAGATSSPAVIRTITRTDITSKFYDPNDLFATTTGLSGGTARSGQYRFRAEMVSTGGLNPYSVDSDGGGTPPTGTMHHWAQGYAVATTTVTDITGPSGTKGYNSTGTVSFTLQHRPWHLDQARPTYVSRQAAAAADGGTAGQTLVSTTDYSSGGVHTSANFTFNNRYRATSAGVGVDITFATDSTRNNDPMLVVSAAPSGYTATSTGVTNTAYTTMTADPRITFTNLHQINDSAYGTPPTSKEQGTIRLSTDLSFLSARVTDVEGNGINGISWSAKLWDEDGLISSEASPAASRSTTSETKGGQAGWASTFLVWNHDKPTGNWIKKATITAPSTAIGLESNNQTTYALAALNPSIVVMAGGGPTDKSRHFVAGETAFQVGLSALNVQTGHRESIDTDAGGAMAYVALFRLQDSGINAGLGEFLNESLIWTPLPTGAVVDITFHRLAESRPGSKVYIKTWTPSQTAGWGDYDIFVVAKAQVGSTPYGNYMQVEAVGRANQHHRHSIDVMRRFK